MSFLGELEKALEEKQSLDLSFDENVRSYLLLRAEGKNRKEACDATSIEYKKAAKLDDREDCLIYIAALKKMLATVTGITENYILSNLQRVYERCMTPVFVSTKDGGYEKWDTSGAMKALELMGKHIGMFSDKIEVNHTGEINLVNQISLDEAKKALTEDTKQTEVIEVKPLEESIEHIPKSN